MTDTPPKEPIQWMWKAKLIDIHDADTATFMLDMGFDLSKKVKLRLLGYDAAELKEEVRGPAALQLTKELVYEIEARDDFNYWVVKTTKNQEQTFDRYLGTLFAWCVFPELRKGKKILSEARYELVNVNELIKSSLTANDLLRRGSKWNK